MVVIAASALYGAFLRPDAGESLLAAGSRRDALEEAQLGVVSMETLEDQYRRSHGRYAWSYFIFDSIPGAEAAFTGVQRFRTSARASTDGMAVPRGGRLLA